MNIELPLDGKQQGSVRPTSKALFHSDFALEAFVLIGQEAKFYGGQLAELTGCKANYASQFLRRLEEAGLIERLPTEPGQARRYFRRRPSPIWELSLSLAHELLEEPESTVTQLTPR
jgi:predicted transcriptional regulator